MRVDEENRSSVEMVKGKARKFWRFSSNEFWKNIGCLVSGYTFSIGGSSL